MSYMKYSELKHMSANELFYAIATLGISNAAIREAAWSGLPGRENGPADAYRHLLLSAELTRRFGEDYARQLLDAHEWSGNRDGQTPLQEAMDRHNNELGIQLGLQLRSNGGTWNDVCREARNLIDPANPNGNTARWLPQIDPNNPDNSWHKNPTSGAVWPPNWQSGPYYRDYSNGKLDFLWDPEFWDLFAEHRDEMFNPLIKPLDALGHWIGQNLPTPEDIKDSMSEFYKGAYAWLQRHDPVSPNFQDALQNIFRRAFDDDYIQDTKDDLDHAESSSSPIILDLDGNGVATTAVHAGAYFDHAGDGFAERTGWVDTDDGLLVRDLDGNGLIDTGAELFGNETRLPDGSKVANGFEALALLDSNCDGQIDANDPAFTDLKIWIDADGDGCSQPKELWTLAEAGVASIATVYANSDSVDVQGNAHRQVGTYTRADGTQALAEDVWFAVDRTYSLATTWADVPSDVAALPDLPGYGTVRDLHQAMALDVGGRLKALVAAYVAESDEGQRHSLLDQIVYVWTDVDGINPASRGSYVDARQLAALEKLLGDGFYQPGWGANPGATAGKEIGAAYDYLADCLVAQLDAQTRYADLYADIAWTWDDTAQRSRPNFTGAIADLQAQLEADPAAGLALLDGFARNLKVLDRIDATGWQSLVDGLAPGNPDAAEILRRAQLDTLTGHAAADKMDGTSNDDYLLGFGGDDTLNGRGGNDVLAGGAGNDTLEGGSGNDLVDGGAGDDLLDGNSGSDVYLFQTGFGQDHIHQYDSASDVVDTARFADLSSQAVARITRQGDDLALDFLSGDRLIVDGYFESAPRRVDAFEFADGGRWDMQAIKERANTLGTAAADVLYGYTGAGNRIYGLDGNDELHGNSGNDLLHGGLGDDLLYGQSGDDVLDGGAGSDTLKGGTGNDSYIVDSSGDVVVESSGSGTDSVLSSVGYTLPSNVENLTLAVDAGNINGIGNPSITY